MKERIKMPRENRAAQFAPFDALKGLSDALRLKEYEAERIEKGEMTEEKAKETSRVLLDYNKGEVLFVTYFDGDKANTIKGAAKIDFGGRTIEICGRRLPFEDVIDLKREE